MPESLLAAQHEAIQRKIEDVTAMGIATPERITDAVLELVGAWLVDAVQAERERGDALAAAIKRIWTCRVYEDGEMAKGISVEMVGAIRMAAEAAELTGPPNPWFGLGMLEQPDPADVAKWRAWQEREAVVSRDTRSSSE